MPPEPRRCPLAIRPAFCTAPEAPDGTKLAVYDMAFRPDNTQLIVAAGNRVYVYDAAGNGHQDTVYCVAYSRDGKRFASGGPSCIWAAFGFSAVAAVQLRCPSLCMPLFVCYAWRFACGSTGWCDVCTRAASSRDGGGATAEVALVLRSDRTVSIWTTKGEGILKYHHHDAIQALAYNPVTHQLASCTTSDFGMWGAEQKSVSKHQVDAKVLSCSWTNDGKHIAMGHFNGHVVIRNKDGSEVLTIRRHAPVWSISWNPSRDEPFDILAVGCWDQTLSFHSLAGKTIGKDKELDFDPTCIAYFSNGEYMCIGGSNRKCTLWTKEGVQLTTIWDYKDTWVWCCRQRPKQNYVAVGTNDGVVAMYQLIFATVHGLYQDLYAHRDFMTDVEVQQLVSEKKLRVKCRDYVKKIAIYKDRLAVQLPERIMIYELYTDDHFEMKCKIKDKIQKKLECNLLVVTSNHIVLCQEKKLQLFTFQGDRQREWVVESSIRYIKVVGGPPSREALLVGLKNGQVLKIFMDNAFPIELIGLDQPIRCLDLSASRMKLAVVDEQCTCLVYHIKGQELIFHDTNAISIAWNSDYEDMLCFSSTGLGGSAVLNIKTVNFPVHQQKLQGFVVGFKGSKIFCLPYVAMHTIDVPQSASLYRYLERKDYHNAYKIACLGVTEADWRTLAVQALSNLDFEIARKAFIRIRDVKYIELLNRIEMERRKPGVDDNVFLAEIYAYQGKYGEAAKCYQKCKQTDKAIEMYSDLKMWADAMALCENKEKLIEQTRKQARWAEEMGDWKEAADSHFKAGEHMHAITIMGDRAWVEQLIDSIRQLPKTETLVVRKAGEYFRKLNHHSHAAECFTKIGDTRTLMEVHVEFAMKDEHEEKWEEAFSLLKDHPEFARDIYLPRAEWLALRDRFEEAHAAFRKAKAPELALKMIETLAHNCVVENRFSDAAYYFWKLALENLRVCQELLDDGGTMVSEDQLKRLERFQDLQWRARVYHAYSCVHMYVQVPFTVVEPTFLFDMARYLLMNMVSEVPYGVSKFDVIHALAFVSSSLEAYKLAQEAYAKMQYYVLPPSQQDHLDRLALSIRAKPFNDKDDMHPVCYRCSFRNIPLNPAGDHCTNCLHPFVRCFRSFDILPLVEFCFPNLEEEQAAMALLKDPLALRGDSRYTAAKLSEQDAWKETQDDKTGAHMLRFVGAGGLWLNDQGLPVSAEDRDDDININDPFAARIMELDHANTEQGYQPVNVELKLFVTYKREEIFVVEYPCQAIRPKFYRNRFPQVHVVQCEDCKHFFHENEYEFEALKKGGESYVMLWCSRLVCVQQLLASNWLQFQGVPSVESASLQVQSRFYLPFWYLRTDCLSG
eukprot:gene11137-300_t